MREIEQPFHLELEGSAIKVSEHELEGKRVFHVNFDDGRKPLALSVGVDFRGDKFWTAIPPGRNDEVAKIGKLIADYVRSKRK
jgi:hypothetical protein